MSLSGSVPVTGSDSPNISLVLTVLNEGENLSRLLDSITRQTRWPDEVVIVDGGSTDDSAEILERWSGDLPLRVIHALGANISAGRNIAIRHSEGDIIAVTDAGVTLDSTWLEHLTDPLIDGEEAIDAVGGFFVPDAQTTFEHALAATTLPDVEEISPGAFLPSSRSFAFRRSWFEAGVRYPEWLDYCEDLVLDLRLKRAGARFIFAPDATVRFRPRKSALAFWRQYYLYARGDGRAGLFMTRHLARYLTYVLLAPSFVLVRSPAWRAIVVLGAIVYMRRPIRRLRARGQWHLSEFIGLTMRTVMLRALGDVAKMAGYPVGLWWRFRTHGIRQDWTSIPDSPDGRD